MERIDSIARRMGGGRSGVIVAAINNPVVQAEAYLKLLEKDLELQKTDAAFRQSVRLLGKEKQSLRDRVKAQADELRAIKARLRGLMRRLSDRQRQVLAGRAGQLEASLQDDFAAIERVMKREGVPE